MLVLDALLDNRWQLLAKDGKAFLGNGKQFFANREAANLNHAYFFGVRKKVIVAMLLCLKAVEQGLNHLARVLKLLVLEDAEVNVLVLPVFNQEFIVDFEESVDLLESSANQQ